MTSCHANDVFTSSLCDRTLSTAIEY